MSYKGVNLNKIDKMSGLAIENGLRLHFDSIKLFEINSFPSAFFLSNIALEEIGKSWLLMDFMYHEYTNQKVTKNVEYDQKTLKQILSHRRKQISFANNLEDHSKNNNFFKRLYTGSAEIKKQNSLYVGLPLKKNKVDIKGKIIVPNKRITKLKAKQQITNIHSSLTELTFGHLNDFYILESSHAESVLSQETLKKLNNAWPFITQKTKKFIRIIKECK